MIKIAISDLKEFLARSRGIKQNNIIPILAFVKLHCQGNKATLSRTNTNAFVVHELKVKCKKEITLLLDYSILGGVVEKSKAEEIEIDVEGKKIVYKDGEFRQRHELQDENLFPKIPQNESTEKVVFNQEVLEALSLSKNNLDTKAGNPFFSYAHINPNGKGSYIFGTTGTVIFYKHFSEKLPTISLDHDTVSAIARFPEVIFSENGNYNFFDTGHTLYGFIKPDFKATDISNIIKDQESTVRFVMDKKQITEYCQYILKVNPSTLAYVYFRDGGKNTILLSYANEDYNLSADEFYEIEKHGQIRDFCFNPSQMITLLKDLPYDKLQFALTDRKTCFVTTEEDSEFVGVVREIVFQNQL
jgi:DNA polymerase III sliding clamp (beta) subunit (PCNA family)